MASGRLGFAQPNLQKMAKVFLEKRAYYCESIGNQDISFVLPENLAITRYCWLVNGFLILVNEPLALWKIIRWGRLDKFLYFAFPVATSALRVATSVFTFRCFAQSVAASALTLSQTDLIFWSLNKGDAGFFAGLGDRLNHALISIHPAFIQRWYFW